MFPERNKDFQTVFSRKGELLFCNESIYYRLEETSRDVLDRYCFISFRWCCIRGAKKRWKALSFFKRYIGRFSFNN